MAVFILSSRSVFFSGRSCLCHVLWGQVEASKCVRVTRKVPDSVLKVWLVLLVYSWRLVQDKWPETNCDKEATPSLEEPWWLRRRSWSNSLAIFSLTTVPTAPLLATHSGFAVLRTMVQDHLDNTVLAVANLGGAWVVHNARVLFVVRTGRRAERTVRRGHRQPVDLWLLQSLGYLPRTMYQAMGLRGTRVQLARASRIYVTTHGHLEVQEVEARVRFFSTWLRAKGTRRRTRPSRGPEWISVHGGFVWKARCWICVDGTRPVLRGFFEGTAKILLPGQWPNRASRVGI